MDRLESSSGRDTPPSNKIKKIQLPLFDEFLLYLTTNNYSTETIYNYERDLITFTTFLKSQLIKEFSSLTKGDVEQYKAYLLSQDRKTAILEEKTLNKLQSGSVNRALSSLRSYLKFLIYQDFPVPVAPEHIKMVRREKNHYKLAELNELISLIEAPSKLEKDPVVSSRNRAMLEMLFSTGMRISELLSLNRKDIDSSGRIFVTGKGKKQRFVYLTERAKFHLDEYFKLRTDTSPALFVPQKGKRKNSANVRISTNYLQERIKRYREKLGIIIPTTAHSLRHAFATYMAEEGASVVGIQMLLGHESLDTTTRYVNAQDKFAEETHRKFHPLAKIDD
ncbi:tyrosine-type recombinase/integrase [Candidatus Daviesbacteria bacterium]|nr:tyrosine-type recombinase/integrase [Candidatus Daviesbacteria bacterium]